MFDKTQIKIPFLSRLTFVEFYSSSQWESKIWMAFTSCTRLLCGYEQTTLSLCEFSCCYCLCVLHRNDLPAPMPHADDNQFTSVSFAVRSLSLITYHLSVSRYPLYFICFICMPMNCGQQQAAPSVLNLYLTKRAWAQLRLERLFQAVWAINKLSYFIHH